MADDLDSQSVARRSFSVARRGYEQQEVRAFLHEVSALLERIQRETAAAKERADRAEARVGVGQADESMLLEILGEETTRVLTSAREAAAEIRTKAETSAERIISEATSEAATARADALLRDAEARLADAKAEADAMLETARVDAERRGAEADDAASRIRAAAAEEAESLRRDGQEDFERARADAEAEVAEARDRGREMVGEAQAVRERVLRDLAVRRKRARQQVEKLNAGRERLLQAYDVVRSTVDEATDELRVALSDARTAADAAARRVEEEADPTLEQLDQEVTTSALLDPPVLPADPPAEPEAHDAVSDDDADSAPGPLSGEVPAVADEPAGTVATPAEGARRRKGRRRKGFEGLPPGELTKLAPPSEEEGVRVLAEPDADVDAPAEPDAEPESDVEPAADEAPDEADTEAEAEVVAGEPEASVDDIFARLRADQDDASDDEPEDAASTDDAAEAEPAEVEPEPDEDTPFTARDAALAPLDKELGRRLKRVLADEQNEVLDLLRRAKPKGVDDLLPSPADHASRWGEVGREPLAQAATAAPGAPAKVGVGEVVDELAASLTGPLRERIERTFSASDGNLDDVADRVRALYREWKGQRLTDALQHATAAAFAKGAYAGVAVGASVRWVVDARREPCPDCDDNVLAGALTKGEAFPTGQPHAPAHPGCRCLVLVAT